MKYLPFLILLLSLAACTTTKSVKWNDRAKIAGEWEIACSGPIGQPDQMDCPEIKGKEIIEFDAEKGTGRFIFDLGVQTIRQDFKMYQEGNKLMIYYVDKQGNTSLGEIVRLDKTTLVVHYAKEGIMTVQGRRE